MLQLVAVCFRALDGTGRVHMASKIRVLQCVAMCCNVLQLVAVCCRARGGTARVHKAGEFFCVALCCSVLQLVAACCTVLLGSRWDCEGTHGR